MPCINYITGTYHIESLTPILTLTPTTYAIQSPVGQIDLYISRCPSKHSPDCHAYLPNSTYHLASTRGAENDNVDLTRQDDYSCFYMIGVNSLSYYTAYTLSATLSTSTLSLQSGVAVTDHVEKGKYDYFSYFLASADQTMRVTLITLTGDADLFMSTVCKQPNAQNR